MVIERMLVVDDIASGRRLGIGSTNAVVTEAQQPNLDPLCEDELNLEDISASTDSIQLSEDSSSELHGLETEMTSFLRAASKRIDNLFTMTHLLFTYRRSLGAAYTALEEGEDSSTPPYELEFDPRPDILHIAQKFPLLRQKDPQLIQRLGRANARRRLWLKVKRDHDKLLEQSNTAAKHDMPIEHDSRFSESDPSEPNKSFSTPRTRSEGLTVSSNASASGDVIVAPFVPTLGVIVEAAPSQRTYATAVASSEGIDELFPGLPEEADNGTSPFICPYCFETQQPGMSEEQWRYENPRYLMYSNTDCIGNILCEISSPTSARSQNAALTLLRPSDHGSNTSYCSTASHGSVRIAQLLTHLRTT